MNGARQQPAVTLRRCDLGEVRIAGLCERRVDRHEQLQRFEQIRFQMLVADEAIDEAVLPLVFGQLLGGGHGPELAELVLPAGEQAHVAIGEEPGETVELGDQVFFGKPSKVTHVGTALGDGQMIEAANGGSWCTNVEVARQHNACTKINPISRRGDLVAIVRLPIKWEAK